MPNEKLPDQKIIEVNREHLAKGTIRELVRARDGEDANVLTDEELLASRRSIIPDSPGEDVWVFAYGSLLWNPVIEFTEKRLGRVHGYHRRFCLKTNVGRGGPENPGLILGLDRGGSCVGLALRIDRKIAAAELDLLWRREMFSRAYTPKMLPMQCHDGSRIAAVGFVMNRASERYVADLSIEQKADMIVAATGFIGPCIEYLERTHETLTDLGINDQYINRILALARNISMAKNNTGNADNNPR